MEIEYEKVADRKVSHLNFDYERGEIRLFGVRVAFTNLLPACEKMDQMFGTGAQVIISCMIFEQGRQLFEAMMRNNPGKSREELLKEMVNIQAQMGWGITNLEILSDKPPKIEVTVKNPFVKSLRGSSKYLIGSFWAGVLSEYFDKQLKCATFFYNEKEDEFRCVITP
jgi:hypothetical protein